MCAFAKYLRSCKSIFVNKMQKYKNNQTQCLAQCLFYNQFLIELVRVWGCFTHCTTNQSNKMLTLIKVCVDKHSKNKSLITFIDCNNVTKKGQFCAPLNLSLILLHNIYCYLKSVSSAHRDFFNLQHSFTLLKTRWKMRQ